VEDLLTIENLPDTVRDVILRKSEGNPFFIEEVIRSLIELGAVYREGDHWKAADGISDVTVPDTIQSVILSRVDRLQEEARYVLQCASVIGRLFKYRLLDHLTQHEKRLNDYLGEFENRDLVHEERTFPEAEYAFKHAFTQEATYQGILEKKRSDFHLQVAQGIERLYQERLDEYFEELAEHYSKSEDVEKAVEYMLKSGEKAKRNYANETAISYYQRVLDMIDGHDIGHDDWKLGALKGIGEIYLLIGKLVESGNAFENAIALAKEMKLPAHDLVRLYSQFSNVLWWQSRSDEGIRYGEMGLDILGNDTECLESALMNCSIAAASIRKGNFPKFSEYVRRNMAFIKKVPYSIDLVRPYAQIIMSLLSTVYINADPDSAWEWAKELERQSKEHSHLTGIVQAWFSQCLILMREGNHKESFALVQKNLELCKQIGDIKYENQCHWFISQILFDQGNIEEARIHACESLKMAEMGGIPKDIGLAHLQLGNISMCQRSWDETIYHYQKFAEIEQNVVDNPLMIAVTKIVLGYAYMRKGDYDKAIEIFCGYVDRILELQDKWNVRHRLFELLNGLEYVYRGLGRQDEFLNFCKDYREKHAESIMDLPIQQWYLEPAHIDNKLSNPVFSDDFSIEALDLSWNWVDIFNDCHYKIVDYGLEIDVANGRDLLELKTSAPRLMIEASGDFAIQVCVSIAIKDKPQMGGLLIWKDNKNYVCFERGRSDPYGFWFHGYINNEDQMAGRGFLPEESESTYMRLERVGNEISAYCSIDDENWLTCGKLSFAVDDPIQIGIYAHGMIDRTIYCGEYRECTATVFRSFEVSTK